MGRYFFGWFGVIKNSTSVLLVVVFGNYSLTRHYTTELGREGNNDNIHLTGYTTGWKHGDLSTTISVVSSNKTCLALEKTAASRCDIFDGHICNAESG